MATDNLHEPPETAELHDEKSHTEGGKLAVFLGILRRFIGVKDINAVRFSLPAQLLEPLGNLEYWNYLDRPDYFVSIGESEDPVDRMLEVIRFWYTKDLKYVKGKVCKPYNSVLGEFFRCKWDVDRLGPEELPDTNRATSGTSSRSSKSIESATSSTSSPILSRTTSSSSRSSTTVPSTIQPLSNNSSNSLPEPNRSHRVVFLTEQVRHHPPVSAFYAECRDRGLILRGYDHIAAKFTGTSIKVFPGDYNKGILLTLKNRDNEEYSMSHPTANITGFISLKVHPYVTVQDYCVITCPKTKMKALLKYHDESWIMKPKFHVEGVIFRYDPENDTIDKIKSIPEKDILIILTGSWKGEIYFSKPGSKYRTLLVNLEKLNVIPKKAPPMESQLPTETQKVWEDVTSSIHAREFSKANKAKQTIEAKQRRDAAARKERNEEWVPKYFKMEGTELRPELTEEGEKMLQNIYTDN